MSSPRVPVTILLPPSEGKADGGDGPGWDPADGRFGPALGEARAVVATALAKAMADTESAARLLGVGGRHLERARAANLGLVASATLPAAQRYTGVVWEHLDPASIKRPKGSVLVVSGLLGLIEISDPVPHYRLKMGARLPELGALARWWKPLLTTVLNEALAQANVLDLLPGEHAAAWIPVAHRWCVRFESGARAGPAIGHDAKAVKGLLARHVLSSPGSLAMRLRSFETPGWRYDRTETARSGPGGVPRTAVVVQVP